MPKLGALKSSRENNKHDIDEFEKKFLRYYPHIKRENIESYILIRRSEEKEGTKAHQKWEIYYNYYSMFKLTQARLSASISKIQNQVQSGIRL